MWKKSETILLGSFLRSFWLDFLFTMTIFTTMIDNEEKREKLTHELLEYFLKENFQAVAARNVGGYKQPQLIHNDGFGDQEDKQPDIIAFDASQECFLLGIARTGGGDLESEESLTEYNVFLDQADDIYGKPYRLYIIAPSNIINQLASLITHYIHREYWHKITFVSSHVFAD